MLKISTGKHAEKYRVSCNVTKFTWSRHANNTVLLTTEKFGGGGAFMSYCWGLDNIVILSADVEYSGNGVFCVVRGKYTTGETFKLIGDVGRQFLYAWDVYTKQRRGEGAASYEG